MQPPRSQACDSGGEFFRAAKPAPSHGSGRTGRKRKTCPASNASGGYRTRGNIPGCDFSGGSPRNQINPKDDLYKISVTTNLVQIPVMVKDGQGRRVDGLLAKRFHRP